MKNIAIVGIMIMLTACGMPMSNDQIIKEREKCFDAGMDYTILVNKLTNSASLFCIPKEGEKANIH